MRRQCLGVVISAVLASACASDAAVVSNDDPVEPIVATSAATGDVFSPGQSTSRVTLPEAAPTTVPPTTTTATTSTTTTIAATTVPPTSIAPPTETGVLDLSAELLTIGTSVEGRPIVAERYGTIGGRRVLVIGIIHGNEDAGVAVVDELRARAITGSGPAEVELWLIESMNPDGQAAQDRHNANEVDLNRNFPHEWGPIGQIGDSQYAGPFAASEPETQAMVEFISQLRPDIAIWYHQDANLIIPSSGRQGRIRSRYAELTGLPLAECCSGGGIYTGIAATWARVTLSDQEAVPFIVELPGGELTPAQVDAHATAVETISSEG